MPASLLITISGRPRASLRRAVQTMSRASRRSDITWARSSFRFALSAIVPDTLHGSGEQAPRLFGQARRLSPMKERRLLSLDRNLLQIRSGLLCPDEGVAVMTLVNSL